MSIEGRNHGVLLGFETSGYETLNGRLYLKKIDILS